MMGTSMGSPHQRTLDLHSGDEVIAEIQRLRSVGYQKTKNWNLTEICDHLTKTMRGGMDGFGFRLPWILRATIVKWMFAWMLRKRRIPNGAATFASLKPQASDAQEDPAVIDRCIETLREAQKFRGSLDDYPLLDDLDPETWKEFMWLHAAHHLAFLIPNDSDA
jgi:hypothetical protein